MTTKITLGEVRALVRERIASANASRLAEVVDQDRASQRIFDLIALSFRSKSNLPALLGFMRSAGISEAGVSALKHAVMLGDKELALQLASSIIKREIFFE